MAPRKFERGTVQARAQELILASTAPITPTEACRRVLSELYGSNTDQLLNVAANAIASQLSSLKQSTYNLPDPRDQLVLDIPGLIWIDTVDGPLYIPRDQAEAGHVRQWARRGVAYHSTQRTRFKHLIERDLDIGDDLPDSLKWAGEEGMRAIIADRKLKALEGGGE